VAWIDDSTGGTPSAFCRVAQMLGRALRDPLANWFSDEGVRRGWHRERWQRVVSYDPTVTAKSPGELGMPLGYLFKGAGHVYTRSAWDDPNATWAFFGAGPFYASHSRDDEGHFLIGKQGHLVSRQGGQGGNDDDFYNGGSLIYNIVTIYDRNETFRRSEANENDGGLIRHVYTPGGRAVDRGRIVAFEHTPGYTYAAADLTAGYRSNKAREVTRQFLYLRGAPEFFVVFDRVESTTATFPKHWFLHVPTRPELTGVETVKVAEHVSEFRRSGGLDPLRGYPVGRSGVQAPTTDDRRPTTDDRPPTTDQRRLPDTPTPERLNTRTPNAEMPNARTPERPLSATWLSLPEADGDREVLSTGRSRMFLTSLLPQGAVVTRRGGKGHDAWGHPLEPTAQYNHERPGRERPPICPWRLEVAAPDGTARVLFLHVFEVAAENQQEQTPVRLIAQDEEQVVLEIGAGDGARRVSFRAAGPLGGTVGASGGETQVLTQELRVAGQYP
jgi:hypothetical protein